MSLIFCISIGLTFVWIYIFWSQLKRFNPDIGLMRLIYSVIYSSLSQLAITSFMANSLIESSADFLSLIFFTSLCQKFIFFVLKEGSFAES